MRSDTLHLALGLAFLLATGSGHAEWVRIASEGNRTVEIDPANIFDSDHNTKVAWGRIVFNGPESQRAGYRTIKALNRYDCENQTFTTIKRVYLDEAENVLREENIPEQIAQRVQLNSIDQRIWRKMCGLAVDPVKPARSTANTAKALEKVVAAADAAARASRTQAQPVKPSSTHEVALTPILPPPSPLKQARTPPVTPAKIPVVSKQTPAATPEPTPAAMPMQWSPEKLPAVTSPPWPRAAADPRTVARPAPIVVYQPEPDTRQRTQWHYSGPSGPHAWGDLRQDWSICRDGKRQSPIDFEASEPFAVNLDAIRFNYGPSRFEITNSARVLRVKVLSRMGMEVRGQRYALEGFTFHHPGEIISGGMSSDMSVHFIHRSAQGDLAILAVPLALSGEANSPLQTLLNNLPLETNIGYSPTVTIDLAAFLPTNRTYYLYMGSLSIPPCTENVLWVTLQQPVGLANWQFEILTRLHSQNARPPQPAHGRMVLKSH